MPKLAAVICSFWGVVCAAAALDVSSTMLIEGLALTDDAVVFSYAGDLWSVGRTGGEAARLTETDFDETYPVASPDGRRVAFTSEQGGARNVWVLDLNEETPVQWTYHPKYDRPIGWTPDGERVLFRTGRYGDGVQRLCTIGEGDPLLEMLPLPQAHKGAYAPDGVHLVYAPVGWTQEDVHYRYYRGGMTSPMWIVDLRDASVDIVFGNEANHTNFVWSGDTIFYTCDETGTYNIYAYDSKSGTAKALTQFDDYGVDAIAVRGNAIAFVRMGGIYLLDVDSGESKRLNIQLALDAPERESREIKADRRITDAHVSDDGETVAVTARGDVFIHRVGRSAPENITQTSGVAERGAAVSPDGKRVAYFSDALGEYHLVIRDVGGKDEERFIEIEESPSFYRQLVWSPDGRHVVFTGKRLGLWLADSAGAWVKKIDASNYLAQDVFHPNWSPDSRYFTYERGRPNHQHDVVVYDTDNGDKHVLTENVDATRPVFDRNGKYLYYLASDLAPMAAANQVWSLLSAIQAGPLVTREVHAVVLQSDQPAPYFPGAARVNEAAEVGKPVKKFRIDWDGLEDRIVPLPVPERDYTDMLAGANGIVYLTARNWPEAPGGNGGAREGTYRLSFAERPTLDDEMQNPQQFQCVDGGERLFMRRGSSVYLQQEAEGEPEKLDLGDLDTTIDPVEEWSQMYREAWRLMRDYFYDAGHHGQNLAKLEEDYAAFLPSITRRTDLNALFIKMLGHISISHMAIGGGDTAPSRTRPLRVGLLGADFAIDNGRFRIEKLYRRSPAYGANGFALAAPLDQPGVNVDEGDYLISVDEKELDVAKNLYSQLEGLANRPTTIEVSTKPDGSKSREYTVVPLSGTNGLRRANRDMEKRERVHQLSGGTIGFVSITQFGPDQIQGFIRQVVAASDKSGLVIDQRNNGGGITSDALIHMLIAPPLHAYDYPYGDDFEVSPVRFTGPKVLVINEMNFSAAETFPLMFDIADVGTIVGMRTGGGGTGTALYYPDLIDGGRIAIPNRAGYNPRTGEWAENNGVSPDVEVQLMPEDFVAGRDPQLERAVAIAMERAKNEEPYKPKRPAYVTHP